MRLTEAEAHGLNVAFEDSYLLGAEIRESPPGCGITLAVHGLPADGTAPSDRRVQVVLKPVGRVAASVCHGWWDDEAAPVEAFGIKDLLPVAQRFNGVPLGGWRYFNTLDETFQSMSSRLSLDWRGEADAMENSLCLFLGRDNPCQIFYLRIWFRDIQFFRPSGEFMPIQTVIDEGKRWWDGFHSRDPRTDDQAVYLSGLLRNRPSRGYLESLIQKELFVALRGFRTDPALLVDLYKQIYSGIFWTLVERRMASFSELAVLTYPRERNIQVVPVFTAPNRSGLRQLFDISVNMTAEVGGYALWPRMLDIVKTGECEVELDPGEPHGIRLTREMILGMVRMHGGTKA